MKHVDLHCDTLMTAWLHDGDQASIYDTPYNHLDIKRLKEAKTMVQFFAEFMIPDHMWTDPSIDHEPVDDLTYLHTLRNILIENTKNHPDLALARNAEDILKNEAQGKISAILSLEDGRIVNGQMDTIYQLYDLDVRNIGLTWNFPNCFGSPNSTDPQIMNEGLTDFGKEAVRVIQDLGILVDVSHLSDGGFWDVLNHTHKPFLASHSNARALAPHPRNLTDDMLKALGERGGVAGLNLCNKFVNADPNDRYTSSAALARHARHMADVGGADLVAIGTDFDGIDGGLEISDPTKVDLLIPALKKEGFTEDEIEGIFHANAMRVITEAMN